MWHNVMATYLLLLCELTAEKLTSALATLVARAQNGTSLPLLAPSLSVCLS